MNVAKHFSLIYDFGAAIQLTFNYNPVLSASKVILEQFRCNTDSDDAFLSVISPPYSS